MTTSFTKYFHLELFLIFKFVLLSSSIHSPITAQVNVVSGVIELMFGSFWNVLTLIVDSGVPLVYRLN